MSRVGCSWKDVQWRCEQNGEATMDKWTSNPTSGLDIANGVSYVKTLTQAHPRLDGNGVFRLEIPVYTHERPTGGRSEGDGL